jgi:hypothetical protein
MVIKNTKKIIVQILFIFSHFNDKQSQFYFCNRSQNMITLSQDNYFAHYKTDLWAAISTQSTEVPYIPKGHLNVTTTFGIGPTTQIMIVTSL